MLKKLHYKKVTPSTIFSLYYIILCLFVCKLLLGVITEDVIENIEFLPFAYPFYLFPISKLLYLSFFGTTLAVIIVTVIYPVLYLRITVAILCCTSVNLWSSAYCFGWVWHDYYHLMTTAIFMCFLSEKRSGEKRNFLVLRLVQTSLLVSYFTAGLWKIRNLESLSLDYLTRASLDHIALSSIFNRPVWGIELLREHSLSLGLVGLGFAMVLLFQLTTLIPIFFNRLFFTYGVMILFFHLSTLIFTNIHSVNTASVTVLFLLWLERTYFSRGEEYGTN